VRRLSDLVLRGLDGLVRLIRRPRSTRVQAAIGVATVLLLAVGAWLAVDNLPPTSELRWWPMVVLVVVGTPWGFMILAAEVGMTGRLAGVSLDRAVRLRVAIIGTAMNQLPLPGAAVTRLDALVGAGVGIGRATAATLTVGVTWVAVASAVAGVALIGLSWASVVFLVVAVLATLAALALIRRSLPAVGPGDLVRLCALEIVFTATSAARFALALAALNAAIPIRGVATMAASAAFASAVGLAPGGIGIREGLATLLGPAAGVPAAIALLAALVNRATAIVGALVTSLVAMPVIHRQSTTATAVARSDAAPIAAGGDEGP
jgi:hypothetical protein